MDRRRLRNVLRTAREQARMTQEQVATAMDWSPSKIIRIESGMVNISTNDLRALLDLYNVATPEQRSDLIVLARTARRPPWWAEYRDSLSRPFIYYIGLEPNARELRFYNAIMVPGLLQTEAYARAALIGSAPREISDENAAFRLKVRMTRQDEFFGQNRPPELTVVLDEAALRRRVGGDEIMREQLGRLAELAALPHVKIHVIPFTHGAHSGTFGPYVIMDFPDPAAEPPVLFLEGALDDELVREKPHVVAKYREAFRRLMLAALDPDETVGMIRRAAAEI
jgi:transcriptional regulator with XRE-family HTH domain